MDEHQLNRTDFDLGSTTPAVVGDRHVFQVGKSGIGYLLNQDHLRGEGGELFAASLNGCYAIGGDAFKDTGATVARQRSGSPNTSCRWHRPAAGSLRRSTIAC